MTKQNWLQKLTQHEDLNFLLTNRIPRLALTHFMGWFSQRQQPWLRDASIAIWKKFSDLDLKEAKKQKFDSLHDCFIRELADGARPIDGDEQVLVSPCDAIVGACGQVIDGQIFQAKGFPYSLHDLLGKAGDGPSWRDGVYVTLRITSSMYHRFHAPHNGKLKRVDYFSGDTWNVNPIALKRVEKLFCKNERALLSLEIGQAQYPVAVVPVAAVLVASIRIHGITPLLHTRYQGPTVIDCDVNFSKGQEMGWFQHGSTILVFGPKGFSLAPTVREGEHIKVGQALLRLP